MQKRELEMEVIGAFARFKSSGGLSFGKKATGLCVIRGLCFKLVAEVKGKENKEVNECTRERLKIFMQTEKRLMEMHMSD